MNKFVLLALLATLTLPLVADTPGDWVAYVTYAPGPVVTEIGVHDADWQWMKDITNLLPRDGFTFVGRRDDDHWMGLTQKGAWWLLQIRDASNRFNFRARVDATTGRITVERGVDWSGADRDADAAHAATLALAYVERARTMKDLFPLPMAPAAPAMMASAMAAPSMEAPHATAPAMSVHGADLGSGGAELWQRLVDGNLRFVGGMVTHPNQSMARIEETAMGQKPFAIVVTCSDSRVPPEVLFDQGLGDLFVIRTAGEVVTEVELGSIEYAIEHLKATYLVVLGHERCGAVDATLKGGDLPPNIEAIAAQIRPAVEAARFFKGDPLDNAVRENAKMVLAKIKGDEIVAEALRNGQLNVKAAYYDLDTGKVAALP